jgi:hypothetical protein
MIDWLYPLAVLLTASGAFFVPVLAVPGYELAEALALVTGILGGLAAVSAVKRQGAHPLPATLRCAAWMWAWLAAAVLVVGVRAAWTSHCDPLHGWPFVALLPFPTALLAAALGGLLGTAFPRGRWAGAIYLMALGITLAGTLWPIYFGPQAFAFHALLGWVPGPLYDEDLPVPRALIWFRALTLGQAVMLLALIPHVRDRGGRTLVALGLLYAGSLALEHVIGSRVSVADLEAALGARREENGLRIHYPRELGVLRTDQLWRNAALRRFEVATALGLPLDSPVEIFFHRSTEEKGRLTGATRTHFTKPWLRQIQTLVDDGGALRHEMVHALAAAWASGPFGASGGVLHFDIALTEGLAEGIDWPGERYTLHQWSRGMRQAGLAPPITRVMTTPGFYAASQGRAYTLAGSFVRFLLDRYGRDHVHRAYETGDLSDAFGKTPQALGEEWAAFVDAVPGDAALEAAASDRFREKMLFARLCAREAAALHADAERAEHAEDWSRAATIYGRCAALDPADSAAQESRFRSLIRAGDSVQAAQALATLRASPGFDRPQLARVEVALADEAWAAGKLDDARMHLTAAREAGLPPSAERAAHIREMALGRPDASALGTALRSYFDAPAAAPSLLGLREAFDASGDFAPLPYLMGLGLANQGERSWSLRELDAALRLGLPADLLAQAYRVRIAEEIDLAAYADAERDLALLTTLDRPEAEKKEALDLESRLAFERDKFGTPLAGAR